MSEKTVLLTTMIIKYHTFYITIVSQMLTVAYPMGENELIKHLFSMLTNHVRKLTLRDKQYRAAPINDNPAFEKTRS